MVRAGSDTACGHPHLDRLTVPPCEICNKVSASVELQRPEGAVLRPEVAERAGVGAEKQQVGTHQRAGDSLFTPGIEVLATVHPEVRVQHVEPQGRRDAARFGGITAPRAAQRPGLPNV